VKAAHQEALAAFDAGGEDAARARHRYVLERHMLAQRIREIIARTAERCGVELRHKQ